MNREFAEQMKVISHYPVKVFIASYISRYWYPYRPHPDFGFHRD